MLFNESGYSDLEFDHQNVELLFSSLITNDKESILLVAKDGDGQIFGGIAGIISKQWFSNASVSSDLSLFIAPDKRKCGAARDLLLGFIKKSKMLGADLIVLANSTGVNLSGVDYLYKSCGLKKVGGVYHLNL